MDTLEQFILCGMIHCLEHQKHHYEHGSYFYEEKLLGDKHFCAMRTVYENGQPLWSMVCYGNFFESHKDMVLGVLKKSLDKNKCEKKLFSCKKQMVGDLEYVDMNMGNINDFSGIEKVYLKNDLIYEQRYTGGLISA